MFQVHAEKPAGEFGYVERKETSPELTKQARLATVTVLLGSGHTRMERERM